MLKSLWNSWATSYIYFWAPTSQWMISGDYSKQGYSAKSGVSSVSCPADETSWTVWGGGAWNSVAPTFTCKPTCEISGCAQTLYRALTLLALTVLTLTVLTPTMVTFHRAPLSPPPTLKVRGAVPLLYFHRQRLQRRCCPVQYCMAAGDTSPGPHLQAHEGPTRLQDDDRRGCQVFVL